MSFRQPRGISARLTPIAHRFKQQRAVWAFGLALIALGVYAGRVFYTFGCQYTDEDQGVFWFAAHEFLHLRVREPCFYGQSYNTLVASVPAALLLGLGVPEWVAVPAVALTFGFTPWLLLAHLAWKSRCRWWAVGVITSALLLPPAYYMLQCLASYNEGVLLVTIGFYVAHRAGALRRFLSTLLLVLGVLVNPNSALLAAPMVFVLARTWWSKRQVLPVIAGGLLGLSYRLLVATFYAQHPAYRFHPEWPLEFSWSDLLTGLQKVSRHWGDLSPIPDCPWLPILPVVAGAVWLLGARRWRSGVALLGASLLAVASLGINKVHDGTASVFFHYSRMYLALPLLGALTFFLLAREGCRVPLGRVAQFGLFAVLGCGALYREVTLTAELEDARERPVKGVTPVSVESVLSDCRKLDDLAKRVRGKWIFDWNDNRRVYACSALSYGRRSFLFPPYERRTWLLNEADHDLVHHVVVTEAEPNRCARLAPRLGCRWLDRHWGIILISSPKARPALELARHAGLSIRPF